MEIKYIIVLIVGLINIILGFFILKKNSKSPINFWYFLLCFSGGGWAVVKALQLSTLDLFWQYAVIVKLIYIAGIFAPFSYLMLTYHFPYRLKDYSKKIIGLVYAVPIIMACLVASGVLVNHETYIVNGVLHREIIFFHFLIFFIYFYIYVIWGLILLLIKFFKDSGIYKLQIKYLTLATVGTFFTTGTVSVIFLLFNNFSYDWLGAIFLLIHFSIAGYLIFYKFNR
jgi:hypothetical protein